MEQLRSDRTKKKCHQVNPIDTSRRQGLRTEINSLTKQYRKANEEERVGLAELRTMLREKRDTLKSEEDRKI